MLASIALVLVASAAFLPRIDRQMADFEVDWRAGTRVLAAAPLYRVEDGHFQYKYLPAFAFVMAPLARLPLKQAKVVWLYVVLASIAGLVAISYRERPHGGLAGVPLLALVVLIEAKFFAHEATLGQFNAVMAISVLAALVAMRRGREWLAGALLAASVVVKPYPVIFIPYLLLTRRWRTVSALLGGVAAAVALPSLVFGVSGNLGLLVDWAQTTTGSTAPNLLNQDNVSIWAMWAKWIGPGTGASALALVTVAALAGVVWWVVRHGARLQGGDYLETSLLLTLMPLCSPQGWDYTLLTSTPAVMLLVGRFRSLSPVWRAASAIGLGVMGLSVFDLMGREAYAAFMATSAISVCGLIIVGALIEVRRTGTA